MGSRNITPAHGNGSAPPASLGPLKSTAGGGALYQLTPLAWSSLNVGDVLTLTVAAGKRNNPALTWSDQAFFGLTDGAPGTLPTAPNLSDMVRAHIFLCMLAYHVQREMEQKLAPLLFREEDIPAAESKRASPVAKAQRSDAALKKEAGKPTSDGQHPVQSFRSLLASLATLCEVTCRPRVDGAGSFKKFPLATSLQARAFEFLNLKTPKL